MDEYPTRPVGVRLDRLRSTPAEIASLLEGRDRAALARRPDAHSWSVVAVLDALSPRQWQRGGIHRARGRMAVGEWVASLAGHDDNHLAQLRRTLDDRP